MKLLAVLRFNPFPPRAGSAIVAYNSIKNLSEDNEIDFVCLQYEKGPVDLPDFVKNAEFVYQKKEPKLISKLRMVLYMFAGIPPVVSEFHSKEMKKRIREIAENGNHDAILLFEMNAIQYCPRSSYKRIIVNIEDFQSLRASRMGRLPVMFFSQKFKKLLYAAVTERYEKRVLPLMARVLLLSQSDMNEMLENGRYKNIGFMPYGVDKVSEEKILDFDKRTEGMIILSGNMFHPPNVDGVLYFLQEIFPLVLREYQSARLWIVGSEPDNRIYEAAGPFGEQVIITGRVDDVSDYIRRAKVSVCPVRLKIGVQTKVLEALSWGTPVVSTSAGNSGIGGCSGKELWVEDNPADFAARVVSLLMDGDGWNQFSDNGRHLIEEKFSWEGSVEQLKKYLESFI